jgi:hypothetical protein
VTKIFINYRTEDEPFGAVLLDHELSRRFGSSVVFRASKSIAPGADFSEQILTAVRGAQTLLVVMGPRWLDAHDAKGRRRLRNPDDWVRREIVEAFQYNIRVVPILLNADLPAEADLPEDIRRLAACQYLRVHHRNSQRDVEQLVDELIKLAPDLAPVIEAGVTRRRRTVIAGILLALLLTAGLVTWLVIGRSPSGLRVADEVPPPGASSQRLPDGTYVEMANSPSGPRTFDNPHILINEGKRVPNETTVRVSCKVFSTVLAGNQYFYRIATDPWDNKYYSPANSYLDGDPPGGPYTHGVDAAVPDCPS